MCGKLKIMKNLRRKIIVNREVQYDVLMYVGIFVLALFSIQAMTAYVYISQVSSAVGHLSALEFIDRYKVSFLVYQTVSVTLCMAGGIYFFNRLTLRIAGPLYNMRRVLKKAQQPGEAPLSIQLRENDYFKEEIDDVNSMLKKRAK